MVMAVNKGSNDALASHAVKARHTAKSRARREVAAKILFDTASLSLTITQNTRQTQWGLSPLHPTPGSSKSGQSFVHRANLLVVDFSKSRITLRKPERNHRTLNFVLSILSRSIPHFRSAPSLISLPHQTRLFQETSILQTLSPAIHPVPSQTCSSKASITAILPF